MTDYNTSRSRLILPEYGRNIQKMVDYAVGLESREERNRAAQAIIAVMGCINPHLRDVSDFKHKLWDHLAIMSDFKLDIDFPYDLPERETFQTKPHPVSYPGNQIKCRHYGKIIEEMIKEAVKMEEGELKSHLKLLIANYIKRSYLTWNRDSVDDESILADMLALSGGKLSLDPSVHLYENIPEAKEMRPMGKARSNQNKNKKRKNFRGPGSRNYSA
ncbi:MAG: DUF4290 domain-containing protein [Bacteroidales bacterium]|nr:DUF4290 domain-containing protein [Bacteroidales bacterium]